MDLNQLLNSNINININNETNELFYLYKNIILKIILACEIHIFKICNKNNININLTNSNTNHLISDYLYEIFSNLDSIDNNIVCLINKINELSEDGNKLIKFKIFYIINEFYKIINREKNNIDILQDYTNKIKKNFNDFWNLNTEEINQIFLDKITNFQSNYKLDLDYNE